MKPTTLRASRSTRTVTAGFTLIELLIAFAVVAVLVTLAAPTISEMMATQRLRGVTAQLVTDIQFARSEAAVRGKVVRINFGAAADGSQTCYVIYTSQGNTYRCNCLASPVCPTSGARREIRTVNVPASTRVALSWKQPPPTPLDSAIGFDPVTGGLVSVPSDMVSAPLAWVEIQARVDADRTLRTTVVSTGRPSVCAANAAVMGGDQCP